MHYLILVFGLLLAYLPMSAQAGECGDLSPTTEDGISLHEAHHQTLLTSDEKRAARGLLKRFRGHWRGTGHAIRCLGEGSRTRERVTEYEIDASGTGDSNQGELRLELDHDQGTITERVRLVSSNSYLSTSNTSRDRIEVIGVNGDTIEWLHRYKAKNGKAFIPHEARWKVEFRNRQGRSGQQAVIQHWVYSPGGLASKGQWVLNSF